MSGDLFILREDGPLFEFGKTEPGWRFGLREVFVLNTAWQNFATLPSEKEVAAALKLGSEKYGNWEEGTDHEKMAKELAANIVKWADGQTVRLLLEDDNDDVMEGKTITGSVHEGDKARIGHTFEVTVGDM